MNDDETFFKKFHEAPRPEFSEALYKRINQPVNANPTQNHLRRMALTFAAASVILLILVFSIPTTRAKAIFLARQIGAFLIVVDPPHENRAAGPSAEIQPTAAPNPNAGHEPVNAASAEAAAKIAGFTVLAPTVLPDGYAQSGPFTIASDGKTVVTAYTHAQQGTFILLNQFRYQPGDEYIDNVTAQETLKDIEVRGQSAVWITGRSMTDPTRLEQTGEEHLRPANWLIWEENEIAYTLMSDDLTLEQALEFAEGLK